MAKKAATKYIELKQNDVETRLYKKGTRYLAEEKPPYDDGYITVGVFTKENLNTLVKALKQADALRELIGGGLDFNLLDLPDLNVDLDDIPLVDYIGDFDVYIREGGQEIGIGCKTITRKELDAIIKL